MNPTDEFYIYFRIRSDHNEDNSVEIVQEWLNHVADQYKNVDFVDEPSEKSNLIYNLWCYLTLILFSCGMIKITMRLVIVRIRA